MNLKLITVIAILFSTIISAGLWYFISSQSRIESYIQTVNHLERELAVNGAALQNLQNEYLRAYAIIDRTNTEFSEIREQNQLLRAAVSSEEFENLARDTPETLEGMINNSTAHVMRCLEIISGSPLTLEEKNAQTQQQYNPNCPWLFDPNN